ncbi:MAG: hypothetical protein WCZ72_03130 [Gemmobacter sp.]
MRFAFIATVRTSYTLQSLSAEFRMDRRRLSRLLQKIGKVPSGATDKESGNLIFDAAETLSLMKAFQSAIRLHDLPEYFGASSRQIEILYRSGLLKPLVPVAAAEAVHNIVFARDHLDEMLAKIANLPTVLDADREKYHSVPYACQRGAGPFETVLPRIMSGEIPCCRGPCKHGIEALIVRLDDVRANSVPA